MKFQRLLMATVLFAGIAFVSVLQAETPEELFAKKCGDCHKLNGVGKKDKGPDLGHFATKRSAGYLKEYTNDPGATSAKYPADEAKRDKVKYTKQMGRKTVSAAEADKLLEAMK